jgi:hypothetical protein
MPQDYNRIESSLLAGFEPFSYEFASNTLFLELRQNCHRRKRNNLLFISVPAFDYYREKEEIANYFPINFSYKRKSWKKFQVFPEVFNEFFFSRLPEG